MDKATKEGLMRKIQALSFAKVETELYLDAHKDAAPALEYYRDVVLRLNAAIEEYEAKYGPITAAGTRGNSWTWTAGKWPWQYDAQEDK